MSESDDATQDSFILLNEYISSDNELELFNENISINNIQNSPYTSNSKKGESNEYDFGSILVASESDSIMKILINEDIEINNSLNFSYCPVPTENDSDKEMKREISENDSNLKKVDINEENKLDQRETEDNVNHIGNSFENSNSLEVVNNFNSNTFEDMFGKLNSIMDVRETMSSLNRQNANEAFDDTINRKEIDIGDNIEVKIKMESMEDNLSTFLENTNILKDDYLESLKCDEMDFRVNVLMRSDEKDIWETNQYIGSSNDDFENINNDKIPVSTNDHHDAETGEERNSTKDIDREYKILELDNDIVNRETKDTEKNDINMVSDRKVDETDFRVNVLMRDDSKDVWETNKYIQNDDDVSEKIDGETKEESNSLEEIKSKHNCTISESLRDPKVDTEKNDINAESDRKVDETDFRVNVLMRDDLSDVWNTNQYIEKDIFSENINRDRDICNSLVTENAIFDKETKEESDISEEIKSESLRNPKMDTKKNDFNMESDSKVDETDFRVNVLMRDDSKDLWETNKYIQNDNNGSENIDYHLSESIIDKNYKETRKECDLTEDKESENERRISESLRDRKVETEGNDIHIKSNIKMDETDFRDSIIMRDDSENKWVTNQHIQNDNAVSQNINCKTDDCISSTSTDQISSSKSKENCNLGKKVDSENVFCSLYSLQNEISGELENDINIDANEMRGSLIGNVIDNESKQSNQDDNRLGDINPISNDDTGITINETHNGHDIEVGVGATQSVVIEELKEEHVNTKALGSSSPSDFKSLNSIISMLFHCAPFRMQIVNYHRSDNIACIDLDNRTDITIEDALFVNDFCKLFAVLSSEKEVNIKREVETVQNYFKDQSKRFSILKGFRYILNKINSVTKTENKIPIRSKDEADISFLNYKSLNYGFVCDLFWGQISVKIFCNNCQHVFQETYHPLNSIELTIPRLVAPTYLDICIKNYFSEHPYETDDNFKCCNQPDHKRHRKITHAPEFFFIYVDRKALAEKGNKNYIESYNGFIIETEKGVVLYSINSVLDKIRNNQNKCLAKCFTDAWWVIDDTGTKKIRSFEIINQHSVGFMLKKQNEN